MKGRRFKYCLRVLWQGHILNPLWKNRLERRRIRGEVIGHALDDYLLPYVSYPVEDTMDEDGPRRVFSLWLQGEDKAPALVKACLGSIRQNAGCEVVVLDESTLGNWISLPESVIRKYMDGRIRPAHFADLCRLELLYRHGGVWMDATDFLPAPLPEWLWREDFFVYQGGDTLPGFWGGVQNCFIRARKGSYLVKVWRDAAFSYWEKENSAVDYFLHQRLLTLSVRENRRAGELFGAMPALPQDPTHLLWFNYADAPFEESLFREISAASLFQKTDYRSRPAQHPVPGSFAQNLLSHE